ncbi:MAG TPA: transposase [Pirellulales bacterium]|jgi:putative transposase|nr:transposase [Pirellulales bacterium]
MSEYHRYFIPGGTYFFMLVTERRAPLFAQASAREMLGRIFRDCLQRDPFDVIAIVLLPDHLHALWALPTGDDRYSRRWQFIKREFTRAWLACGGSEQPRSKSRLIQRRRGVWQRRFWEHMIRDEADLEAHFDYIHYNPVKHGLTTCPSDWPWSTFHRWVRAGHYPPDWGGCSSMNELENGGGE